MNQLVSLLSQKLGLPEKSVESGLAVILGFLKEKTAGTDFEKLLSLIPGAAELAAKAPAQSAGQVAGGGLLGGLMGAAGGLLGGQAGDAAKALAAFQQAGIPVDKIAPLAQGFFQQVEAAGGSDLTSRLAESIPALKALLGGK